MDMSVMPQTATGNTPRPLAGRSAIVTGSTSGIGLGIARALAEAGADIMLNGFGDATAIAKLRDELETSCRVTVVHSTADMSRPEHVAAMVAAATERLGGVDILVNNAGKQVAQEDISQITDEQFDHTQKTNVYAMFRVTKAAVPHMPAGSTIINTTSIQAYNPSPTLLDYATTKASINNFTKGLAQQLAPKGIRVNAVAPGPIWTPLQVSSGQPKEELPEFGQSTPLGRAGQPAELAPAYVFLASPESSYVLGETLNVNGGSPSP
jgi:NAD(P)-dependent dehydrogenase (short-subunit alcohol dehydrogenase family)